MRYGLAFTAAAILGGGAQAATIINGSFETGINPPTTGAQQLGANNTNVEGWTIENGGIDWVGTFWQASNGTRSIDLTLVNAGAISQTIATVRKKTYYVTFDMAGNPNTGGGPTLKSLDVTVNGGNLANYTFDTAGFSRPNMGWTSKLYTFVATSSSSTLRFRSNNGFSSGPTLDNIEIALPEPSSWAMFIVGFGLVGTAVRRRRAAIAA